MPDYEAALHQLSMASGLSARLLFLGDRDDVPDLLVAMDVFVWLSFGEGMPRADAEGWHYSQFQAFELLMGRMWTQIGRHPDFLDIVGFN